MFIELSKHFIQKKLSKFIAYPNYDQTYIFRSKDFQWKFYKEIKDITWLPVLLFFKNI